MKTLGLDIGTTTISAVILDNGVAAEVMSADNASFLPGQTWERLQDPGTILERATKLVDELLCRHPDTAAIGVTGQMHGILYLDKQGDHVSPLYTWQDGRGDLPCGGEHTWASRLSETTGYPLASGYGMVTHAYNIKNSLVPDTAVKLCTIMDYVAMKLAGETVPRADVTNSAGLGMFCLRSGCFDLRALRIAGIDSAVLPEIVTDPCLGVGIFGIPVFAAIGDNQASFLGATEGQQDAMLINVGTGSQISVFTDTLMETSKLESRPYPGGGWLTVGASLCGGRSYALLESFFRQTVKMVTGKEESAYSAMERALEETKEIGNIPLTVTTFQGTRRDPDLRGSICRLGTDNFTPVHLMHSFMNGIAEELFSLYREYLAEGGRPPAKIIGSGNGLRKNKHLRRAFETVFGQKIVLSRREEEAACGAAVYAVKCLLDRKPQT